MTAYYRIPYRVPRRYRRRSRSIAPAAAAAGVVLLVAALAVGRQGHNHPDAAGHLSTAAVIVPAGGFTPESWSRAVLAAAGLPVTACNVAVMTAWARQEGGHWRNQARYNVLNSTQPEPGDAWFQSKGPGSARIRIYVSWQQGINATITTLGNGYYPGILAALRAGNSAQAVAYAVDSSVWGTRSLTASC